MSALAQMIENRHAPIIIASIEPEGGEREPVDLSDRITGFTYNDTEKKQDKCTFTINNFDGSAWDEATFAKGNIIHVRWGYPGFMTPERSVVITGSKGGRVLTVEAKAKSVLMHRETICECYENVLPHEVVEIIAERNGFGSQARVIEEITEAEIERSIINQPNITDARMLKRLAHKHGFEFYVDFDGLHWHRRDFAQAPQREFRWYNGEIENSQAIIDYSVENDLTAKPGKTRHKGINPKTKKPFCAVGSDGETKRKVLQEVVEVYDRGSGKFVKQSRTASDEDKPSAEDSEKKAKRRADGRFRKIQQRAVKMTIAVLGDPLILAKTVVFITGISKRLTGRYYVTDVTTSVASGYQQTLKLITDGSRGHTGISVNDAIFPPTKTGKGTGDPFGAALNLARVLNDAQDFMLTSEGAKKAGIGVSTFISKANALDLRVTENPGDLAAYKATAALGRAVKSRGESVSDKALIRTGQAIVSAANRGLSTAEAAISKGDLNEKGVDKDPNAQVYDQGSGQWVPKSSLRGKGSG